MKPTKMLFGTRLSGTTKGPEVVRTNPFTGKPLKLALEVVSEAEAEASKGVLTRYGAKLTKGVYRLKLADGTTVEVVMSEEEDDPAWTVAFSAFLQDLSGEVMTFLFELCSAGNLCLDGDDLGLVTTAQAMERSGARGAALARSPEELERGLKEGTVEPKPKRKAQPRSRAKKP
jgi:hypothetical protein